ncbi:putative membrane protein [Toxoplasma gondii TgCatPRC2]|uniref:Membrane protein n=15 Tax=Toxoplasma gondii TaxID=5811 RepID=A0A125YMB1_TOXGV|nr:hypothetical protein TGME49_239755 [Toxoplasma gondii ME49]EPR60444.1 hypothetical protein TGGT1_239755 [Toxoplasma gondii GT1]ESS31348.1 putative membrane protein [Toxoplasma gondii VEG]KAF4643455.1 hypothetical protein TGRH88_031210 [Toxoplasma gondii]KFG39016.1 putative membrane protein [Toxoplasma gondii p89]KFG39601.1 putative membrane protein [Toxoplasma gondii GAB2-2007-GAL-DOM2]KFG48411.1 putative membrane protein [Toxoplasma gondii FOU]KFG59690.1 putative membrane protein [Toxopl|eukprot:XP_018637648.1 hypothetical protein TGME49_239755 [Toxoplasma gondii ME49]
MEMGRRLRRSSAWTRWFWTFRFNWERRRNTWRMLFYFNLLAGCCAAGIVFTFILHVLTSDASFFINYRCGAVAKNLIRTNFVAVMVTAGIMGLSALLMSRVTGLFSAHALGDFKPMGHWTDRVGFIVKWLPWFISLCFFVLIGISIVNIVWIFATPTAWCSRRWSNLGLQAVRNCRAWYGGTAACLTIAETEQLSGSSQNCNDGDFLQSTFFLYFIPLDDPSACSFSIPEICLLFKNSYSSLAIESNPDWESTEASRCEGLAARGVSADDFIVNSSSDLYRYLMIYTGSWCMTICALLAFFFYTKYSSHFESHFSQPSERTNFVVLSILRPLTPWNEGI